MLQILHYENLSGATQRTGHLLMVAKSFDEYSTRGFH